MNIQNISNHPVPTPVPTNPTNPTQNLKAKTIQMTRRATANALLECAEIMETKQIHYYTARRILKENNPYWLSNDSFRLLRYAGENNIPFATIQHQIDMVLLAREHILQEGLLDYLGKEILG